MAHMNEQSGKGAYFQWTCDLAEPLLVTVEERQMEYQLEIDCPDSGSLKVFSSTAPFMPVRVGDLLDATIWGEPASGSKLRVLNVEHSISEKPKLGIDPSGRIVHRVLIHTERVPNTAQMRA
jgi:hypothetical protein